MFRADVIDLVREDPSAHGIFDAHERTYRRVKCSIKSVSKGEAYQAMSQGLNPTYVFIVPFAFEYKNERLLRYQGTMYRVLRAYINGDAVELTCERVSGDV